MDSAMRRTGIDVIGNVPWGTHFCQFYETSQDLIDILVPYFKEGLESGEFCMWVTSEPLKVDQATAALRAVVLNLDDYIDNGQIEILDYSQWYTRTGKFSADEVLQGWVDKLTEAQKQGFEGLRLTGNTFWLEKADWDDFTRYEETVNDVIGRYKMLAICTYSLQKCNALEVLDVVANHQFALIKRSGRWEIIESEQHKKTEQALRESEEKLSALYNSMVEGVALHEIVYDSAGNPANYIIADVNPSFEKITGLPRDNALGKRASVLYGTNEPPYLDVYARVASFGKPESFETYFEPMKKHFSISVFSPERGKFATVFSDITERKMMEKALQEKQEELAAQSEELEAQNEELRAGNDELVEAIRKLQESEARHKSLAENVPSVLMRYDRDFRVVYLSPQSEKITGIPTEQFIGKTNREVGMPEDLCDMWEAAIKRVFQTGANQDLEFEFPAAEGSGPRTFYLKFAPEFASDSATVRYVLGISTEITERKRMEAELEKLASFPKLNPNPITEFDLTGKVHFLNAVAQQLFPDLQEMGCDHPWLADWNLVVKAFCKNEARSYTHDVLVGERWYQQWMYFVPGTRGIRIYGMDITERKKARETQSLLASIVDSAEEAIIGKALDGIIISWNTGAEKIYGYSADEVIGRPISILIPPDHVDEMPQILEKIRRDERVDRYETTRLRKDGKQIYVSLTLSPITNERGEVVGASTIASDITERKRAEAALQEAHEELEVSAEELRQQNEDLLHAQMALLESEARLRRFYESGLIGVIYWNMDGVITDANDKFLEMVGYSREDLTAGRIDWINMTPPEYRHLDENSAIELKATGVNKKPFEKEYIRKDGTRIPIIIAGAMLDEARFNGVAFVLDITERKKAEAETQRLAEQRQLALDAANLGWWHYDPVTKISTYDQRYCEIFGVEGSSRPNEEILKRIYPDDLPGVWARVEEALNPFDPKPYFAEYRIIREDGMMLWVEAYGSASFEGDGEARHATSLVGTVQDITERKRMEEELCKSRDELEQKVQERTAELSEAKEELEVANEELQVELEQHQKLEAELMKAKEAAEDAVKVKAAFMANMSHELRTPMNSVIGFTGLLLEEPLTIEQKDYVESIRNSGEALMMLINEVLDFSKMDREKMDLELQVFDLRNIIEEALDMVAAQAANKGLGLNYSFDKNVPEAIIGDPGKLRQVLGNLLSNAVKFTKEGEVDVNVSSDPDQDEIHFAVRDTGIGISAEDMEKLFQPFCQLDLSYSSGYEGTGLGLAISKKLVELMGSRIWIESTSGIGSTFHFTIPAETAPAEHKPFLTGSFKGKRILVIEGNQTLRRILGRQVHAWGMVPRLASSIQEIMELLQRDDSLDAVIVDVSQSDMLSVIAGRRDRWKHLPFIALTALGQKVPPDLFQAVLTKPIKPAKLYQALQEVLEKRGISEHVDVSEKETSYVPLRILLAEDNLSNQKVTLEMLKKLGYRADAVVNGQEVLEALERQPYDLIFMDVKMPLMTGIEAAQKIRERWPDNGPKIIAVTAYALYGDKEKCLAAGMDGYIPKPVQKEELIKVLRRSSRET